ncbi:DsrE family protein [Candidatus Micrarchaeota archaeon]|nr:DsrE family protein [Candidatus Micrarchaeota archaeon]
MKLGIVISTSDIEAAWNAFRLAIFSKKEGDEVTVFLVGKAVDYEDKSTEHFPAKNEAEKFASAGGAILACGTCLKLRNKTGDNLCPISSLRDLYALVKESDKVVCF